ncbi:MAG: cytochrome-c peroxidase, partial [Owenweeksia sp.]
GFVEEHINGAPLLHIERFSTLPFVVPPEGLQVLDELIYSDDPKSEKLQIAILAQKLATQSSALINGFRQRKTEPHEVIEACRMELVRILTLGLTGFDTPGSVNAISEAEYCLRFMRKVVHQLLNEMDTRDPGTADELFRQAVQYLQDAEGFDELDRLYFLRSHLQPLYARLYDIQLQLGGNEKTSRVTAWNPASRSFFSGEFLNPYFYTELRKEEDGPALHQLGEKLFYDTRISRNAKLSCASCHNPQMAFTDGQAKSESSVAGMTVQRNSPTLLNAVYADRYFYDLRAFSLEQQAEHVIFNHAEFNTAYDEIAGKLSVDKEYRKLFKKAFPKTGVNRSGLSRALASYVLSLQSFNSDFDKYARGESEVLPAAAQRGFNLFMGKAGCGTCHFAPTFSGLVPPFYTKNESEILGITESADEHEADSDMGRYANSIYSEHAWIYERSFKTSTVRNVAVTAPYFHNGAFQSLEEVVNFYDHGGGQGLGLEIKNQTLPPDSLMLSNDEKTALIAFMQTLTDTSSYKQY